MISPIVGLHFHRRSLDATGTTTPPRPSRPHLRDSGVEAEKGHERMTKGILDWLAKIRQDFVPCPGRVLEVGSLNVNGSPRQFFQDGATSYFGIDQQPGIGVDRVMLSYELTKEGFTGQFDTVICCETLEHDPDPLRSIAELRKALAPGGHLIVTSPTNGFPEHRYPRDYWRLMPDVYEDVIFKNMIIRHRHMTTDHGIGCMCYLGKMPGLTNEIRVFQSYFDKFSQERLLPQFIPYFNSTCSKYFEGQIICDLFAQGKHEGSAYVGLVSSRVREKLNGVPAFAEAIEADGCKHDFYVPSWGERLEVWQIARSCHGERIVQVARDIIRVLGYSVPDLYHLGGAQSISNYQVCRTDLYTEFVEKLLRPAIAVMEDRRNEEFQEALHENSKYSRRGSLTPAQLLKICGKPYYTLHPFITERLFATYAAIKKWCGHCVPGLKSQEDHHVLGIRSNEPDLRFPRSCTLNQDKTATTLAQQMTNETASESMDTDYISPGFVSVFPDPFFPDVITGKKESRPIPFPRGNIPHRCFIHRRAPKIGLPNRDEVHILFNTALQFRGQPALQIGCSLGWSTCHLALAGVHLDAIDPLLDQSEWLASIAGSLQTAGVASSVQLLPGNNPQAVHNLAASLGRKWSLFFIDGNQAGFDPIENAAACSAHAAADGLVLVHNLVSPEVAQALDYFRSQSWNTMLYQTTHMMGVAWRGDVRPVEHFADPSILWPMPLHLRNHPVCGAKGLGNPDEASVEFARLVETVQPFTLLPIRRLVALYSLAKWVCLNSIPGNFVECGTYKGGSTGVTSFVLKRYSRQPRRQFCFDTFTGMPEPQEVDKHLGIPANLTGFGVGTLKAPVDLNLTVLCRQLNVSDVVTPVQGLFADTLPLRKDDIGPIALLHADSDWYQSTTDILHHLYDRVVPGGFIQIDDYGHWEGCKKAVHDFERSRKLTLELKMLDYAGVWLRKP